MPADTAAAAGSAARAAGLLGAKHVLRVELDELGRRVFGFPHVLADEPAPGSLKVRVFNHPMGESGVTFCAAPRLAAALHKGFPRSLHQAPALLPAEGTGCQPDSWLSGEGT